MIDPGLRFGRRGLERRWRDRYIIRAVLSPLLLSCFPCVHHTLLGFEL